jgi:hypothetical protein
MNSVVACEDRQEAFFFVVPLEMKGRWWAVREGETFHPEMTASIDFEGGEAKLTRRLDDGDGTSVMNYPGRYCVQGGRLTIDIDPEDGFMRERIVAAAPVSPDLLSGVWISTFVDEGDGDRERISVTLVRDDVAEAMMPAVHRLADVGSTH